MHLRITQNGRLVSETQFVKGPVHIGRHPQSRVFLSDPSVSRQHAVAFLTDQAQWMIRDLQSANHTYVNGEAVTEAVLKDGDHIKVGVFDIAIDLGQGAPGDKTAHLDDTHAPVAQQPKLITRTLDDKLAPPIRMLARRAGDLQELVNKTVRSSNATEVLDTLLDLLIDQFQAHKAWCSFRLDPHGYAEEEGGRTNLGEAFVLRNESAKKLIEQACEKRTYILVTHTAQGHSVIVVPILDPERILGEIYLESKPGSPSFTMSDLDYAMLLSISLCAPLEHFCHND